MVRKLQLDLKDMQDEKELCLREQQYQHKLEITRVIALSRNSPSLNHKGSENVKY